jgi:hypothetical protein
MVMGAPNGSNNIFLNSRSKGTTKKSLPQRKKKSKSQILKK